MSVMSDYLFIYVLFIAKESLTLIQYTLDDRELYNIPMRSE